jgi:hypothetical protein
MSSSSQQAQQLVETSIDALDDALEAATALMGLCSLEDSKGPRKSGKDRLVQQKRPLVQKRPRDVEVGDLVSSDDDDETASSYFLWAQVKEAARLKRLAASSEAETARWSRAPSKRQCLSS